MKRASSYCDEPLINSDGSYSDYSSGLVRDCRCYKCGGCFSRPIGYSQDWCNACIWDTVKLFVVASCICAVIGLLFYYCEM